RREKRITVFQLSTYSPDYNPIEKLWKKIKQHETHLCHFPTFQDLKDRVNAAMARFERLKSEISPLFNMYREEEATC
ncbi:transposase, partial [Magnetococcales bacterium HHB-1]